MTTQQFTPPQAALVAIDIAKNRHEILIEPGPAMRRRRLSVLRQRDQIEPKLRLSWSTIRIRSGYASSRRSGRSSP